MLRLPSYFTPIHTKNTYLSLSIDIFSDSYINERKWEEETSSHTEVKELSRSKWSNVEEDDEIEKSQSTRQNSKSLSRSSQERLTKGKTVWWGDKV